MGIVGAEEEYHFEVRGWLRVPSAFTAADAAALSATIRQRGGGAAALEMLLQQPALQQCLDATMATFNHVNPPTPHPDGLPAGEQPPLGAAPGGRGRTGAERGAADLRQPPCGATPNG